MHLALFPLAVVLLPGTQMPLHIFEPRYRRMIADALEGSREFGIVYLPPGVRETELAAGWPLCVAHIEAHERLEDGRSNIVVRGVRRVALEALVDDAAPYHVGLVRELPDLELTDDVPPRVFEAMRLFQRTAAAARTIADDTSPVPGLTADPATVAYEIAAALDLDLPAKQRMLANRDPGERLAQIIDLLSPLLSDLERRASLHRRASTNGRGPH